MRSWLPVANAVLKMAVDCLPNPREAQRNRAANLLRSCEDQGADLEEVRTAVAECSCSEDAPVVVYISKMMSVDEEHQVKTKTITSMRDELK
jgi:translation elongation factor EF-G